MNQYCNPLSIPVNVTDIDWNQYKKRKTNQVRCPSNIVGEDFISWLASIELQVFWLEIFYIAPNASHIIHCDGHELDSKGKLNFIVGGDNSNMVWYQAKSHDKIIKKISRANTSFLTIEQSNVIEIYQKKITGFNLVNVGEFHTVYNYSEDRYCLSIAISDAVNNERLDFFKLQKKFKEYICE